MEKVAETTTPPPVEILGVLRTEKGIVVINPDTGQILQQPKPPVKTKIDLEAIKRQYPIDANSPNIVPPMPVKLPGEDSLTFAGRKNEWKRKFL